MGLYTCTECSLRLVDHGLTSTAVAAAVCTQLYACVHGWYSSSAQCTSDSWVCVHACTYGIDTRGTLWYSSTRVPLGTAVYRVQLPTGTAVLYSCRKHAWYGVLYSCSAVRGKQETRYSRSLPKVRWRTFPGGGEHVISEGYVCEKIYAEPVRGLAYEY